MVNTGVRQVILYLTRRCNLRCEYCKVPEIEAEEMTTDQICSIIDYVDDKIKPEILIFFGGEPFLREDLAEIIKYANTKQTHYAIITNGTIWKSNVLKQLKNITLSLDFLPQHMTPELEREIPQILRKSRESHSLLSVVLNMPNFEEILTSTILTAQNYMFFEDIVKEMTSLNVIVIAGVVHAASEGDGWWFRTAKKMGLSKEQVEEVKETALGLKKEGFLIHNVDDYFNLMPKYFGLDWHCRDQGLDYLTINSDGKFIACGDWPGKEMPQVSILDLIKDNEWDFQKYNEMYKRDVNDCPGCFYNHKIQLAFSSREQNVLIHKNRVKS